MVAAYRTVGPSDDDAARLVELFDSSPPDVATFTSPSTVEQLAATIGPRAEALHERSRIAAIGPITRAAAEARGWTVHVTAEEYTAEGQVEALERSYASP